MRIVVYGPERRVGALKGEKVVDLSLAYASLIAARDQERHAVATAAVVVPPDLARLIERGNAGLAAARAGLDHVLGAGSAGRLGPAGETIVHAASTVRLHAPRPAGARIACAGGNFADHHLAMAQRRPGGSHEAAELTLHGVAASIRKAGFWGFWKVDRDCLGPDETLRFPSRARLLDYEGELAIVIGREGRNIKAEDWRSYVWGVTLLSDWSIRQQPEQGRMNFAMQKNFDGSCSLGPSILVGDSLGAVDATDIPVTTHVNGDKRQDFNSGAMVFSFGECLAFLSRDLTFYPGDILSGGTAAGTAQDSSDIVGDGQLSTERFLKPGDVVEVASPRIGVLRNRIGPPAD